MSNSSADISSIADNLWHKLLRSHLNVAVVGIVILLISAVETFSLRHYADQLATVNTPIAIVSGDLEVGVHKSIASLRGWVNTGSQHFAADRNEIWDTEIYPAIIRLKELTTKESETNQGITSLVTELYNLDMWQWHVEDVAQTLGNIPANLIVEQQITPISGTMINAVSALLDMGVLNDDILSVQRFSQLRTKIYQADDYLLEFVKQAKQRDKNNFSIMLSEIDNIIQKVTFDDLGKNTEKSEQLTLFKHNLSSYKLLTQAAIVSRSENDWNASRYLFTNFVLPLEQRISRRLEVITSREQENATVVAQLVHKIGFWLPFITALLLFLMLYISYHMAKKRSHEFIKPVIELESTKEELTQSLADSKALASALLREEEHTRAIVDSSPVAILTMDGDERIRSFNPAAEHIFGYLENEVIGQKMSTLEAVKGCWGHLRRQMLEGDKESLRQGSELKVIRKDGIEIRISMTISDVNLAGDNIWLFIASDITKEVANRQQIIESNEELQASSEELQAQQEELRITNEELIIKTEAVQASQREAEFKAEQLAEANRYKSEFLANMSHELRTPLNSLLILSKSLADNEDGNLSKEEVESAQVVNDSGKNLLEKINEILDLSKAESGKMMVDNSAVIMSNLSSDLNSRFLHMAIDKGISFSIAITDDVPNSFVSDGTKLSQILTNLIGNAIKFTEQGEVKLSITMQRLSTSLQEKLVAFTVIDSGVGIAVEHQSSIFEAFQQADGSTNRQFGGTGLGLSIVQTFSKLLGGTVELESEVGKGSSFTLYLPLEPPENVDIEMASEKSINFEAKQTPPPFMDDRDDLDSHKSLYLIIEDDESFAKILFETCHQQQSQSLVASDGETGLFLAKKYNFTGIILDYMLPGLDGDEVTAILKSDPATKHIPIHIISAVDDFTDISSLDIIGQLTKPVSKRDILQVLEQLRGKYSKPTASKVQLLLIEENEEDIQLLQAILEKEQVELSSVRSGQHALSCLKEQQFDAIIMELVLPDMSGFELLEKLSQKIGSLPPIIVHTSKELSDAEYSQLKESTETIVIKSTVSPERLHDEVHLFINAMNNVRFDEDIQLADVDKMKLTGKTVLIVDDDMRNTFALAKVLRKKEIIIHIAPSGQESLSLLEKYDDIDLVLMDIMMPEMDGYETMRTIREQAQYAALPIIALTAKAMAGDKEACLEAGANDYLAKPVDVQKLLIMMQIWL